ncbi:hypothetical protein K0M31_015997 [Melipona bicolor]|uniref:Uncharacterized protein n=1 Tax=Melipona bicolor TaxID=60889 RepID=A0AA40KT92_9HYME|nr:hypothetical protein K0M31_015997 [Melipona bicolor]
MAFTLLAIMSKAEVTFLKLSVKLGVSLNRLLARMAVSIISLMDNFAVTLFIMMTDIKRCFSVCWPGSLLWRCPDDIAPMTITNTSPIITKMSSTTLTSPHTTTTTMVLTQRLHKATPR